MNLHLPLRITATLQTGIAHSTPWTVTLDGLLASQLWHTTPEAATDVRALDQDNPPDLDLPLARCTLDPDHWHWAATCGWPDRHTDTSEIHYWGTRLDHRHTEQHATALPQHLHDNRDRWKAFWMPLPVTVARTLTWHAIGDPEAIRALLEPLQAIGKKRSQGEGRVLAWTITPAPDLDEFTAGHLSPTGTLARPTPTACLRGRTIDDGGPGYAGIRPPTMHHSRKTDVHLPAPH